MTDTDTLSPLPVGVDRELVLYLEERLADARAGRLQVFIASAAVSAPPATKLGGGSLDVQAYSSSGPLLERYDQISRRAALDATFQGLAQAIDNIEKILATMPGPVNNG